MAVCWSWHCRNILSSLSGKGCLDLRWTHWPEGGKEKRRSEEPNNSWTHLEYKKSRVKSLLGEKNFEPVSTISILSLATNPLVLLGQCCFLPSSQKKKTNKKTTEEVWICHSTNWRVTLKLLKYPDALHHHISPPLKAERKPWSSRTQEWRSLALMSEVRELFVVLIRWYTTTFSQGLSSLRYFVPTVLFCIFQRCSRPTAPFQVLQQSN